VNIRIEIAEIENRNVYRVWHDGAVLIERTTTPLASAARILLARGSDPNDVIEMTRRGSSRVDMRAKVGAVALPEAVLGGGEASADDGGLSDSPETLRPLVPSLNRPLRPSESDGYADVVAVLDENRRVISDGVQWMLQVRTGGRWKPRSYCRTKEALIRCCGGGTPELDALPDRIGGVAPITDTREAAE
jgi:hypothetical protein